MIAIVQIGDEIFEQLKHENFLKMCSEEDMPERLAYYLSEINALHSFREGNGRTQRLFIEILAENAEPIYSLCGTDDSILSGRGYQSHGESGI